MSENEYQQLIERMLAHDAASPMISSETGVKAARKAGRRHRKRLRGPRAGGLAMHFYGSPRMTKDVDIIASNNLSLTPDHPLTFDWNSYTLKFGKHKVQR